MVRKIRYCVCRKLFLRLHFLVLKNLLELDPLNQHLSVEIRLNVYHRFMKIASQLMVFKDDFARDAWFYVANSSSKCSRAKTML